jgi:hypothetical protein
MPSEKKSQVVAGLAMIVLGLGLFGLIRTDGSFGPIAFIALMGGGFLSAYFYTRNFGYLVPGCILLGIGIGSLWEDSMFAFGDSVQIGLGCGFIAIYVIGLLYGGRNQWWPLVPGGFLVVTGMPRNTPLFAWMAFNWPLVFVLIGIVIVFSALRSTRSSRAGKSGEK